MLNRRDNPPKMYPFLPDADKGPIKGFLDLRAVVAGPPPMDGTGHTVPGFMGYHSWLKTVSAGASSVDYLFQFLINDGYRMELREVSVTVARDLGIGRFTGSVAGGSRIDLIMDSSNMTMESVALSDGACEMEPGCVVWVSDALRSVTFMVSNMDRVASDRYIVAAFQGPNTVALSSKDGYGFSLGGGVLGMSVKSPTVTAALPTPTPSPTGVYDGLLTLGGVGPDATGNIPVEALAPVTVTSPARGVLVIGRATPAGTVEPTQNTNPVWRVPRKKRVMTPDEAGYYGYNCVKVSKLILDPPDCYNNKILQIPTLFGTSGVPVGGPGTLPLTTGSGSWVYGMVFPSVWPPPQAYPHTCDGYHHMNVLIPDYPFVTPRGAEFGEGAYPMCFDLKRQCDGPESDYCGYWKILDYVKQTEVWVPLRVDPLRC